MKTYRRFKKEAFKKNKNLKREYELLKPETEYIKKLIELRLQKKMTQKELAEKVETKQPAISRFENNLIDPSIYFLSKVADALGKKLTIDFK